MAPHGRSGGILLGIGLSVFDIGAIDEGDFYVKFTLRYKSTDFKFVLYSIYGLAQSQNKAAFLIELANPAQRRTFLFLLVGILILCENLRTKVVEFLILNGPPFLMLSLSPLILGKLS
jgi:crotonobetainyl-CoA:carnitine CoA-transferase CaiB-like acyl-CoA transferase